MHGQMRNIRHFFKLVWNRRRANGLILVELLCSFLVLCDAFARTAFPGTEVPVGIITALLGGPFFIWLLLSRKSELEM